MTLWRQLRWRIVATNMVVVIVGVAIVLIMAFLVTRFFTPANVEQEVATLSAASSPTEAKAAAAGLLAAFRGSIFSSVLVAALGAIVAGTISSLWLSRQILRPLQEIASSSQRIAHGHYAERVAVPPSDELAVVATNFNQMAEALEQVEAQRIALIGNVSHELRTPLTGLKGYLEGLMDGMFPSNEETFAQMHHEINRLGRLVDDLQDLSRVEAGQISLHIERFDLIPLVERLAQQIAPLAEAQALEVVVDNDLPALEVQADPDRAAQVLLNLLSNAIRYTPEGGRVEVRIGRTSLSAEIEVTDTGIGIPAQALPYLFERFYRVDASRARKSGGSGIGLTIARHLAWAMGGELTASSPGPGQGSTFTFTLPAVEVVTPLAGKMRGSTRQRRDETV
jgi:histidine kinase